MSRQCATQRGALVNSGGDRGIAAAAEATTAASTPPMSASIIPGATQADLTNAAVRTNMARSGGAVDRSSGWEGSHRNCGSVRKLSFSGRPQRVVNECSTHTTSPLLFRRGCPPDHLRPAPNSRPSQSRHTRSSAPEKWLVLAYLRLPSLPSPTGRARTCDFNLSFPRRPPCLHPPPQLCAPSSPRCCCACLLRAYVDRRDVVYPLGRLLLPPPPRQRRPQASKSPQRLQRRPPWRHGNGTIWTHPPRGKPHAASGCSTGVSWCSLPQGWRGNGRRATCACQASARREGCGHGEPWQLRGRVRRAKPTGL